MKRATTTSVRVALPWTPPMTLLVSLLVGCLNPRPEELPSDQEPVEPVPSRPAAPSEDPGLATGGTAASPDLAPGAPQGGSADGQTPAVENDLPAVDAGVSADAGADADAPDAIGGAGASSTSE